jgi:hypothetical protein
MPSPSLITLALSATLGAALLVGTATPERAADPQGSTQYGAPTALGNGTARTFVRLDAAGEPEAIGVTLSEAALTGLPTESGPGHAMLNLAIPAQADLPYQFLSLGWNPNGHEPEGLFTVPHFDFHFYTTDEASVMSWMPGMPGWENATRLPEARYIPQGFVAEPGGQAVPMMGFHWLDPSDPTYVPGGPGFSEVFIWGSYGGEMVFAEPMITKAFFEGLANGSRPAEHSEALAQPEAFATAGYYPTRYTVRFDEASREYHVVLEGLTRRTAG